MQRGQSDQELNFKKRARRRLVGAIALVLLMVFLLPMVLKDRSATSPQEEIVITLPDDVTPTQVPPSDFDSSIIPDEPVAKDISQPEVNASAETTDAAAEKQAVARTTPSPEPKAQIKSKAEKTLKFYVQVGVFSDAGNVKQLQSKLTDLGYKSQTEKIDTAKGKKIRLRTQEFADRNEAAIALENIKDAGLTGMVVSQ